MPEEHRDKRKLIPTPFEEEAGFVRIRSSVHGCNVTVGRLYRLKRNYNNPELFEHGEAYVTDDDGKDNYAVLMVCSLIFYK